MSYNGASKLNPGGIEPSPNWWLVENSSEYVPAGYVVVDVIGKISHWIETHPITQWKYGSDFMHNVFMTRYIISEQLFTLLALKWTA